MAWAISYYLRNVYFMEVPGLFLFFNRLDKITFFLKLYTTGTLLTDLFMTSTTDTFLAHSWRTTEQVHSSYSELGFMAVWSSCFFLQVDLYLVDRPAVTVLAGLPSSWLHTNTLEWYITVPSSTCIPSLYLPNFISWANWNLSESINRSLQTVLSSTRVTLFLISLKVSLSMWVNPCHKAK